MPSAIAARLTRTSVDCRRRGITKPGEGPSGRFFTMGTFHTNKQEKKEGTGRRAEAHGLPETNVQHLTRIPRRQGEPNA
jgi:hypothetical protein